MTQKCLHLAPTLTPQLLSQEASAVCSICLYLPEASPKDLHIFFVTGPIVWPSSQTGR